MYSSGVLEYTEIEPVCGGRIFPSPTRRVINAAPSQGYLGRSLFPWGNGSKPPHPCV
jgi:hypothetical protein